MHMEKKPIPDGYWINARGSLDPIETIKPIDRDLLKKHADHASKTPATCQ